MTAREYMSIATRKIPAPPLNIFVASRKCLKLKPFDLPDYFPTLAERTGMSNDEFLVYSSTHGPTLQDKHYGLPALSQKHF